ncbi:MAG TPA: VanZ family protein [Candidatus Acidoferrales bacterium]|nr:VanZ family protein [Candidatus Acidoferrales bacterium]
MRWLKYWWPAILWAVVISTFSTGTFTSENTSRVIIPMLRWLLPHAGPETLSLIHYVIRKSGHFIEYFVLGLLLIHALRAGKRDFSLRWALMAVLIVAGYASLDEFHQRFVPGRGAAVSDVLLDTTGGAAAQLVVAAFMRWRGARTGREASGTA